MSECLKPKNTCPILHKLLNFDEGWKKKLPGTFKLLHLQAKKYVDKGGGGQKLPILRRHNLWVLTYQFI